MKLHLLAALAILSAGCASAPPPQPSAPRGLCHVCKYNNDLACVNFRLKSDTPKAVYEGRTYVFCSTECRDAFVKDSRKYRPR